MGTEFFYVGVKQLNSTTWQWEDGHTIPHEVGASVWASEEPNGSGPCAAVSFAERISYSYYGELADRACDDHASYTICMA